MANVDATCGGKPSADCAAIVEVSASMTAPSQGTSTTPPAGSSTPQAQTTKIMIPASVKIATDAAGSSTSAPVKLAKGDKVKITYEKKQDANVATSVTITKPGS